MRRCVYFQVDDMIAILRMGPLMSQPMEVEEVSGRCCRIQIPVVMDFEGLRRMETTITQRVAVFQRHDKYAADADNLIPIFDYIG